MTITEFLTARYDEEEEAALHAKGFAPVRPEHIAPNVGAIILNPDRFLADIAAKRAIVAEFRRDPMALHSSWGLALEWVLRRQVQLYAEHADFDPTWRVS